LSATGAVEAIRPLVGPRKGAKRTVTHYIGQLPKYVRLLAGLPGLPGDIVDEAGDGGDGGIVGRNNGGNGRAPSTVSTSRLHDGGELSNLPVGLDAAGGDDGLGHGAGAVGDGDGGGLESVMLASLFSGPWERECLTSVTVMVLEP
jgi:hypothetical protein